MRQEWLGGRLDDGTPSRKFMARSQRRITADDVSITGTGNHIHQDPVKERTVSSLLYSFSLICSAQQQPLRAFEPSVVAFDPHRHHV